MRVFLFSLFLFFFSQVIRIRTQPLVPCRCDMRNRSSEVLVTDDMRCRAVSTTMASQKLGGLWEMLWDGGYWVPGLTVVAPRQNNGDE